MVERRSEAGAGFIQGGRAASTRIRSGRVSRAKIPHGAKGMWAPSGSAGHQFDTVLGQIGFGATGDVTGFDPFT